MQKNKKADGKKKVDRVLPRAVCIVFGVFLLFLFSPAASFVFNEGSAVGMALGIVLLLIGVFFKPIVAFLRKVRQKKRGKIVLGVFCQIVLLVFLYSLVAGIMILSAAARAPAGEPDAVIVLGCRVYGDRPRRMLVRRLQTALEYLEEHPAVPCVLSGGQGEGESVSEAQAMKTWLVGQGISPDRLYTEEKSINTAENLTFSAEILKEAGIGEGAKIAVVTDSYHQYRASVFASRVGLEAFAVNCRTGFFVWPTFFVRELPGPAMFLFGLL